MWGEGPSLVLCHGSHGSWTHWIRNIDVFAQRWTVWVPDLPGYGDSANAPGDEHVAISAALAAGLIELVGAALPVDLIGFSFGGVAAAHLAANHPDLVQRLILVGTGGLETPMGNVQLQRVRHLRGVERYEGVRANLLGLMLHDPASADALAVHLQEINTARGRLNPAPLVLPDRLLQALPRITARVSAIWGEHDIPHPALWGQEEALRAFHPDLAFRVIADAGHWAMYERPDAFNATVLELLPQL
ncbi:MAG: alpha/beta hydrolase [Sphingomonadales bacterium]|nr:MAG: alpha/beta hydrolase [Sphingomonadales bacterium]